MWKEMRRQNDLENDALINDRYAEVSQINTVKAGVMRIVGNLQRVAAAAAQAQAQAQVQVLVHALRLTLIDSVEGGWWLCGLGITEVEVRERDQTLSWSQVEACSPKQSLKSLDLEVARRCTEALQAIAIVKTESVQRRSPH